MIARVKSLALSRLDALLVRRGYTGMDLEVARKSVRDWARARLRQGVSGSVAGLGVVIPSVGRAELVPVEVPLGGRGQITVEVLVSAISSGTERAQWLRSPNAQPDLPFYPGYSSAGRVIAVGPGVTNFAEGDLVAIPRTSHASVATVPSKWAIRVPKGVDIADAALVYLAMISGYGVRRARLEPGDSVCVLGIGPIGALAGRLASLAGAGRVTIVARTRRRERRAAVMSADFRLVDQGVTDVAADVVIEATGEPDAISDAIAAARDGGKIILLGSPRGTSSAVPIGELQARRLRLIGAHISALATESRLSREDPFREIGTKFLAALGTGDLQVSDLIGEAIDPREIGLVYRKLADRTLDSAHLDWRSIPESERVRRRRLIQMPRLLQLTNSVRAQDYPAMLACHRPVRFAVIGCGDIGFSNARAVARARNAELVLVHDSVAELASKAASRYGGIVAAPLEQAMDKRQVDAVLLSVPHDLHEPMIAQAAAAGLHVIIEKPLAVDLASAISAVKAAQSAGVTLSVCFPYRYEAASAAALRFVAAGALGRLRGAALTFHADKPQSYWHGGFSGRATSNWRASVKRSGGGVMMMNMTHFVDLLRRLSGAEIVKVHAFADFDVGQEVEDRIAVTAQFDGGAIATMLGSASTRGAPESRLELWGEHGTLELGPKPRIYTERSVPGLLTGRWNSLPVDELDVRTAFVERFAATVLDGELPDVTAEDGLEVQAFVDAVYRSLATGAAESVWRMRHPE